MQKASNSFVSGSGVLGNSGTFRRSSLVQALFNPCGHEDRKKQPLNDKHQYDMSKK